MIAALFFFYQKIKHENYAAGEKHQIELYEKQLMKNQEDEESGRFHEALL